MSNIVAFDLNKTLIKENSWYDLNIAMGISAQEDEFLFRLSPEGEGVLTYVEWISILARLMKARGKATRKNFDAAILSFNYLEGGQEAVKTMRERGFIVGLITGAMRPIADKVASDLSLDFMYCNAEPRFDAHDMLEDIHLEGSDFEFKVDAVNDLRQKYPDTQEIYYVADGDTDEAIFKVTKGIMVTADHKIHEAWKHRALESGDEFSAHRAAKVAWQVTDDIHNLPRLV